MAFTAPLPHIRTLWRPEQFTRISNPDFHTDTSGWSVSAGINGAGTSITRVTTDGPDGALTCGELVTTSTPGSGINWDLGSWTYYEEAAYGTMYAATIWLKHVSGPKVWRLILGSQGTSTDRDEYVITDLSEEWRPYRVVWAPRGDRTDAQLALVCPIGAAATVRIGNASLYQPEGFTQVENGIAEKLTDASATTTGWDTTGAYIAGAPTSFSASSGTNYIGTRKFALTTTATDGSGVSFPLADRRFVAGRTYRARLAARRSGTATMKLHLGSDGTAADRATDSAVLTASYELYTLDWTPTADRTDVVLAITNNAAESVIILFDAIEVYEVLDDVSADAKTLRYRRGAGFDGRSETPGTFTMELDDGTAKYDPRNDYVQKVQSYSPDSLWLMDELGGNIKDYGTNGYDGAKQGSPTYRVSGAHARRPALQFTGASTDRFDLGDVYDFAGTASFSLAVWVYAADWSAVQGNIIRKVSGLDGWGLTVTTGGIAQLIRRDSTAADVADSDAALDTSRWYHIGATYDGSTMLLYVDGVVQADQPSSSRSLVDHAGNVQIGNQFQDSIAYPAVWDGTALTAADMLDLAQLGSPLAGSLEPGKAVHARADYQNVGYPLTHGNIETLASDPSRAVATVTGSDALRNLGRRGIRQSFTVDQSYQASREHAISNALLLGQTRARTDTQYGLSRMNLATGGPEAGNFFDGTAGERSLEAYLSDLNAATGSVHYIEPRYNANAPWRYVSVDRATITDTAAGTTIDEDFAEITQHRSGHEALENRQSVTWQSFEKLHLPVDVNFSSGVYTFVLFAANPAESINLAGDIDSVGPYLHYPDERIGISGSSPEPQFVDAPRDRPPIQTQDSIIPFDPVLPIKGLPFLGGRPEQGPARKIVVYPDAYVPISLSAGDKRDDVFEFAIPVSDQDVKLFDATADGDVYIVTVSSPRRIVLEWWATLTEGIDFVGVSGTPWLPLDEIEVTDEAAVSLLLYGQHDGPSVRAYVPARGAAEGIARYRDWRYGEPRLRLSLRDGRTQYTRALGFDITDHVTLSADRYRIAALGMVIRGLEVEVTGGAYRWDFTYDLEELPSHDGFVQIGGTSDDGIGSSAILAY